MKSVAIVGGGITGLTAAYRLQQRGVPVTLYESSYRVGGAIQTTRENGYLAEWGPNTILETSPKVGALINDLGLASQRRNTDRKANKNYVVRGGKLIPLPIEVPAFLTTKLFSLPAKIRIAAELVIRSKPKTEDESLADFVLRRLGREFLECAINPFVAGIYAGDASQLSVKYAFPKLAALEQKYGSLIAGKFLGARERKQLGNVPQDSAKKVSFDLGLQVLTDMLAEKLAGSIQLNANILSIKSVQGKWSVLLANGEQNEHSAIILAAPAHRLASYQLETDAQPVSLAVLGEIKHPSVARVVLGFKRADVINPLAGFGFLVPEREKMSILGTTFSSSLFEGRAPNGHVTLTTFLGGARNPELAALDAEKQIDLTLQDLRKLLGANGKPTYVNYAWFPKAIPQYNVGYGRFFQFMSATEAQLPGLYFAGNYRDGVSLANSIVGADAVAQRVANSHLTP